MSITQLSNYSAFIGVIMIILQHYNIQIAQEELQTVLGGILSVVGIIVNWYNRFKKGDVTVLGSYK